MKIPKEEVTKGMSLVDLSVQRMSSKYSMICCHFPSGKKAASKEFKAFSCSAHLHLALWCASLQYSRCCQRCHRVCFQSQLLKLQTSAKRFFTVHVLIPYLFRDKHKRKIVRLLVFFRFFPHSQVVVSQSLYMQPICPWNIWNCLLPYASFVWVIILPGKPRFHTTGWSSQFFYVVKNKTDKKYKNGHWAIGQALSIKVNLKVRRMSCSRWKSTRAWGQWKLRALVDTNSLTQGRSGDTCHGFWDTIWDSQFLYGDVSKPCTPGEPQNSW